MIPESQERLESHAAVYRPAGTPDEAVLRLDQWWIDKHVQGPRVLELGAADGTSTSMLLNKAEELDVVDGSSQYCELVRGRVQDQRVSVIESLFEDYEPQGVYDDVVIARSLDYVAEPRILLGRIASWIRSGGRLHIVVQNAESLHRRLGVALGLMPETDYLNEMSLAVGHRRVYSITSIVAECVSAGYAVETTEGFFLKPFDFGTLSQSEHDLQSELIPALNEVGKDLPADLCSQIYLKCRPVW